MARLGIFGGTFDPHHIGHLILASEAWDQLKLDRVLWVLTPDPPHKTDWTISRLEDRLAMIESALGDNPSFEISTVDIDRPPPHYAVDSLKQLRIQFPVDELVYLMGGDSLADLPTWFSPLEFLDVCDLVGVMCRPGRVNDMVYLEEQLPGISEKVQFIEAPLLQISSSQLRLRIVRKGSYRYYLPSAVYKLIQQRGYYRK